MGNHVEQVLRDMETANSLPRWAMESIQRAIEADRKEGIPVEMVGVGTHTNVDGEFYATFTILCEDENLDEIDDLPRYGTLYGRQPPKRKAAPSAPL